MDLYALKDFPHRGQLIKRDQRFSVTPVDAAILTNQGFARFAEVGSAWPQIQPPAPLTDPDDPAFGAAVADAIGHHAGAHLDATIKAKRKRTPRVPGTPRTPRRPKPTAPEAE